jgi:predicted DNA-binding transcriptional regulator AlpA
MSEIEHTQDNLRDGSTEAFLSKPEVGRRLQIRLWTWDEWMKRGLLPYCKLDRSVWFKWSEIERHLAQTCRVRRRSAALA